MYEFSAGGVREAVDEWTSLAKNHVAIAVENELQGKWNRLIKRLHPETAGGETVSALRDIWTLYDAVELSIIQHTYSVGRGKTINPSLFPDKLLQFDYSLGSEISTFASDADAFLLIRGLEQKATRGRKAVQATVAILSIATSPLTRTIMIPEGSGGGLSAALVEAKTGDILWYKRVAGASDMETPDGTLKSVRQLLADFPAP